jgi:DNA polymerase III subunit alpha, Gram-positive type
MKINSTEFVVFDVETTGLSPMDGDRIIEIAAMKVKDGKVVDKFYSLVNPNRLIPSEATRVNNITDDMVANAPSSSVVLPKMVSFISSACVAGHNVRFDLNFLGYELALAGRKLNDSTPAIDTLKMARDLLPYLSNHKLAYLARSLGVTVTETHRAMADVDLTVQVLIRLIEMATDQNRDDISTFMTQFGIEKPSFKLVSSAQASLF